MSTGTGDDVPEADREQKKNQIDVEIDDDEQVNDHPIEEVSLTVPITDDPTQHALTFRTLLLGLIFCSFLAFANQFFSYRQNHLYVSSVSAQIAALPIGKFMAATLPTRKFTVPFTNWKWSLNPGPFSMKEHVLITIFANCGASSVYAINIITIVKTFYHRNLHPVAALLLVLTTQLLGYGWAGMFRKYLVESPYMWWPNNLVQVSLFRALHGNEKRPKGAVSRQQFFIMVFICSFSYYLIPGYFFPSLSNLAIVCWIWKDSITAQQLGSGLNGLGIGSFGLDWSTVASFLGSPLATPLFAIINVLVGFFLFTYVLLPIGYWTNAYEAKKFPIFTSNTFDKDGMVYNITRIIDEKSFEIKLDEYNSYSKLYLSVMFAYLYGLSFAGLTSCLSHVALFNGKSILNLWRKTTSATNAADIHTRLMKKNYKPVPQWWFLAILGLSFALAVYCCEGFGGQLQLPWWGILLACFVAFFFTLPIGIIQATTNRQPGLNVITEFIIGYILPGKPLANVTFKTYGYISMIQALDFVADFKLGHYMKIPPRSMFIAQLCGTLVASSVYFGSGWWLLESIPNICDPELLPDDSPWTCPGYDVFYNASIIWGVVGPLRMFTNYGNYPEMNWFFLIGVLAPVPVWYFSKKFPEKKWIEHIHIPLILAGTQAMPAAKAVHYWCWGIVGIFFNYFVYKRYKGWWAKRNYVMSAGLDAGVAFMGIFLYFTLQGNEISFPHWWGMSANDHCPLARCPTAPGIQAKGCPVQ
ncbi:hypothetical protein ACFE04_023398 [Oxalis oulophora]